MKAKKILSKISIIVFIILLGSTLFLGCQQAPDSTEEISILRFGAVPGEDADMRRERYEPLLEYLGEELNMEVELFIANDYTATIEAMRAGKVDIAGFGPLSYVLAADMANAEAFAVGYREGEGIYYESYIITHPESGINEISDLKGKNFAFVDPASTGGHLIPRLAMIDNGIDPDKDLASVVYLGGHDACGMAVANQHVDASTIVRHEFLRTVERGDLNEDDLKIIHVSDPFPGGPWAWRKDIPEELKVQLKEAIVGIPEGHEILKAFGVKRFELVDDSKWSQIRDAAKLIDLQLEDL